jgi:hypothetical protein
MTWRQTEEVSLSLGQFKENTKRSFLNKNGRFVFYPVLAKRGPACFLNLVENLKPCLRYEQALYINVIQ